LDDESIDYNTDYGSNEVYKINCKNSSGVTLDDYFLIENRQIGSEWNSKIWQVNDPPDTTNYHYLDEATDDGLLIWYVKENVTGKDLIKLIPADNSYMSYDLDEDAYRVGNNIHLSDYTTPSSTRYPGYRSNVLVTDVGSTGDPMTADLSPYWGGTLYDTVTWSETGNYVGDDLTIPWGETLTIASDKFGRVEDNKKITIAYGGTLIANQGSELRKTLSGTYWSGIDVQNGGTLEANGDFTIEDAITGIDLYSGSTLTTGDNTITIQNCSQSGIWANNTTTAIRNVLCINASNSTYQNGGITVSGATAAPRISRSKVLNSYYGIKIVSTVSSPMACVDSCHIMYNTQHSIVVNSSCRVDLNGYNNIYYSSGKKALNNPVSGSIDGQYNYWGTSADPPTWSNIITFPGVVTTTNYSTSCYDSTSVSGVYKRAFIAEMDKNQYEIADDLESNGDWIGALEIYNNLISQESDPGNKKFIVLSMLRISDNFSHDYSNLRQIILNELKSAIGWYREIYGNYLKNKEKAKEYADKAASINPGQDTIRFAYAAADIEYNSALYEDKFKNVTDGYEVLDEPIDNQIADEKNFVTIETNPFNPSTSIIYSILEPSQVKLDVFSITGQKVATLANSYMSAGVHTVKFDGSRLASGVYFYRFESESFNTKGKMLLVK